MEQACREKNWWEHYPLHQLWCNDLCPLVPRIWSRQKDEYNAWDGGFHWLVFHVWTMSHVSFQFDVELSPSRVGWGFCLPYLRIWIGFNHFFGPISNFFYKHMTRKGTTGW